MIDLLVVGSILGSHFLGVRDMTAQASASLALLWCAIRIVQELFLAALKVFVKGISHGH